MSLTGRRRFGPPPPCQVQGQRSPHHWGLLPLEIREFLVRHFYC